MTDRIRIQPGPIHVSRDDPFKNDLLGRKQFVQALVSLCGSIEGPAVFAVDGRWGAGKTTFAQMLSCCLHGDGFTVVAINAWDTDYTQDPLGALISAVMGSMDPKDERRALLKESAVRLMRVVAPGAIRVATAGILDVGPLLEKEAGNLLAGAAENRLGAFAEHAKSMAAFREQLRQLGEAGGKPLVVIVDELDRCRPTYAVEMLETIKHVFNVKNTLFVLTVNRSQLDRSAAVLYGSFGDPESYFSRFFDVELSLPEGTKKDAILSMLRSLGLPDSDVPAAMLVEFLVRSPQGIRAVERTLHHYALVHVSLRQYGGDHRQWALVLAMLLRLVRTEDYRAFLRNEISDAKLVDNLFALDWATDLLDTDEGNALEGMLIAASEGRANPRGHASELRVRHANATSTGFGRTPLEWASVFAGLGPGRDGSFFWTTVQRIETLG